MKIIKKTIRVSLCFLIIAIIAFFETSFLKTLGNPFNYLQIILTVSVFAAVASSFKNALPWIIVGGFIMDLYSPFPFGAILLGLIFAVLAVKGLSLWQLTSHGVYSLALLVVLGTVFYHLIFLAVNKAALLLNKTNAFCCFDILEIVRYAAANLVLFAIIFLIVKNISKRFKI